MNPLLALATGKNVLKALPYVIGIAALCYLIHLVRVADFDRGAASVQKKWDAVEVKRNAEISKVKAQLFEEQIDNILETSRISNELIIANKNYTLIVDKLNATYQHRLLLSSQRADAYRHQAESGAAECGSLADHASKLDSSLEEGRGLVQELRSTLGLRDTQVKLLGDQIKNDRKLLE